MRLSIRMGSLLLALLLSVPALAMSLNDAMSALPQAKAAGHVGEQPDGYLGIVQRGGSVAQVVEQINQARRAEYQRLAKENGILQSDVEALAGKKAIERTPRGQYIMLNGVWMQK